MRQRPSTGFSSIGRADEHLDRHCKNKGFYQKKYQVAEDSVSILAFREKTLKS
jgi:hypothetical protein